MIIKSYGSGDGEAPEFTWFDDCAGWGSGDGSGRRNGRGFGDGTGCGGGSGYGNCVVEGDYIPDTTCVSKGVLGRLHKINY